MIKPGSGVKQTADESIVILSDDLRTQGQQSNGMPPAVTMNVN